MKYLMSLLASVTMGTATTTTVVGGVSQSSLQENDSNTEVLDSQKYNIAKFKTSELNVVFSDNNISDDLIHEYVIGEGMDNLKDENQLEQYSLFYQDIILNNPLTKFSYRQDTCSGAKLVPGKSFDCSFTVIPDLTNESWNGALKFNAKLNLSVKNTFNDVKKLLANISPTIDIDIDKPNLEIGDINNDKVKNSITEFMKNYINNIPGSDWLKSIFDELNLDFTFTNNFEILSPYVTNAKKVIVKTNNVNGISSGEFQIKVTFCLNREHIEIESNNINYYGQLSQGSNWSSKQTNHGESGFKKYLNINSISDSFNDFKKHWSSLKLNFKDVSLKDWNGTRIDSWSNKTIDLSNIKENENTNFVLSHKEGHSGLAKYDIKVTAQIIIRDNGDLMVNMIDDLMIKIISSKKQYVSISYNVDSATLIK